MTRDGGSAADRVWGAAESLRERCLRNRLSLFLPDQDPDCGLVWTEDAAAQLRAQFIDRPDESTASFLEKLRIQLADCSRAAVQLLVELTWLHVLVARSESMQGGTKRQLLRDIADIQGAVLPQGELNRGRCMH